MRHRPSFLPRIALAILWTTSFGSALPAQEEPDDTVAPAPTQKQTGRSSSRDEFPVDKRKAFIDEKAKKKEEHKPNFELRAVRTSPFDLAIPFVKLNHWTQFNVEVLANNEDHDVDIRTGYERMGDSPHEVRFDRRVHLVKGQEGLRRLLVLLPADKRKSKDIELALYHPDGVLPISPPGIDRQPFRQLEDDQFLIVILSPEPEAYTFLKSMQCVLPGSAAEDNDPPEKRLYYHLVFPSQPSRPLLAETPLAWTTTSYVIWDELDPGLLSSNQQEAMLDWLHWGGQLIVSGGKTAMKLRQSFLAPYLPADAVSVSEELGDLSLLSAKFPAAPTLYSDPEKADRKPIRILPAKPIYVARLEPRPGARVPQGTQVGDLPLVVERSVGRGRVVMTAVSLYQPELVNWRGGYDTFWSEVLLRVPPSLPDLGHNSGMNRTYVRVPARQLSRVRYAARDLGAANRRARKAAPPEDTAGVAGSGSKVKGYPGRAAGVPTATELQDPDNEWQETVAEWRDDTPVAQVARQTLLDATGIEIPAPRFVLKAALAYLVVLVPLNWLVCRFALRRVEFAWLAAPLITLAFSIGILQFAERNVGYDMTSHEIDLVEAYAGHPRAHLSRFTCIYSGSRRRCEFRYREPTAVAMPLATGKLHRDQHIERIRLDWGVPITIGRYEVAPRSIGLMRSEEMMGLGGPFLFQPKQAAGPDAAPRATPVEIENHTPFELWDTRLIVRPMGSSQAMRQFLGDLRPGERLEVAGPGRVSKTHETEPSRGRSWHRLPVNPAGDGLAGEHSKVEELRGLDAGPLLELIETQLVEPGTCLIGWAPQPLPGQDVDPSPDRTIGFTIFLIHLDVEPSDTVRLADLVPEQRKFLP